MKIKLYALCLLVSLAGISCRKDDASAATNGQDKVEADVVVATPNIDDIDPSLLTEAVDYFGLLNDVKRTYNVWLNREDEPELGYEQVTYLGMVDGSPRFAFHRSGGLVNLKDDVVELRLDGLYLVSTDLGLLHAPVLQIPSNVTAGSTWRDDMNLTYGLTGQDILQIMDFTAARVESTTVGAGTYSTLVVEVAVVVAPQTQANKITIRYAKGIGVVLLELNGVDAAGDPMNVRVELIDDGTQATTQEEEAE